MTTLLNKTKQTEGILLVNKPKGKTAFSLVSELRKKLHVKKIGHAGTLDPFATGVMVMLIGRSYTQLSDQFLCQDKEYSAELHLGVATDTFDCDGTTLNTSEIIPTLDEITDVVSQFQGLIKQVPPMYSAKKINGQKLYELARKGQTVERKAVDVKVKIEIISYKYPKLNIHVACSKGTYIRSLADEIGKLLGCGAHLSELQRVKSGSFHIQDCLDGALLFDVNTDPSLIRNKLTFS